MIEIDVDTSELAALKGKIERGLEAGVHAVTDKAEAAAHKHAKAIENRPIPTSSTGRPLWERTGATEAAIESTFPSADTGTVALDPASKPAQPINGWEGYGQRRHQLGESSNDFGDGWTPRNPAGGVIRNDPFFKAAEEEIEGEAAGDFEAAFNQEINS